MLELFSEIDLFWFINVSVDFYLGNLETFRHRNIFVVFKDKTKNSIYFLFSPLLLL